jgi:hypothetical protein
MKEKGANQFRLAWTKTGTDSFSIKKFLIENDIRCLDYFDYYVLCPLLNEGLKPEILLNSFFRLETKYILQHTKQRQEKITCCLSSILCADILTTLVPYLSYEVDDGIKKLRH